MSNPDYQKLSYYYYYNNATFNTTNTTNTTNTINITCSNYIQQHNLYHYYYYNNPWTSYCITVNTTNTQTLNQVYLWPGQFLPQKPIVLDPSDPTRVLSEEELAAEKALEKAKSINGHTCKACNEKNEYATPNQTDGSYICYNCRNKL